MRHCIFFKKWGIRGGAAAFWVGHKGRGGVVPAEVIFGKPRGMLTYWNHPWKSSRCSGVCVHPTAPTPTTPGSFCSEQFPQALGRKEWIIDRVSGTNQFSENLMIRSWVALKQSTKLQQSWWTPSCCQGAELPQFLPHPASFLVACGTDWLELTKTEEISIGGF